MLQFLKIIINHVNKIAKLSGRRVLHFIFFIGWFSTSFAQNGIIKGRVKDGETLLQAATVSLANKSTLTNYAGEFSLSISPGTYTLVVTHVGYKKMEQLIILNVGETKSFQFNMIKNDQLGEVVVLGSRSFIQRSNLNTTVPVDHISSNELKQTGQQSLIQMLNFTVPSFNSSRQNLFEPVTLRGLSPDHLLILLNGARYHNTAFINNGAIRGTLGRGSVSNDLNTIPFSAIEKIEILRDGASAQYGSDAIAGVINIVLKKKYNGFNASFTTGENSTRMPSFTGLKEITDGANTQVDFSGRETIRNWPSGRFEQAFCWLARRGRFCAHREPGDRLVTQLQPCLTLTV